MIMYKNYMQENATNQIKSNQILFRVGYGQQITVAVTAIARHK